MEVQDSISKSNNLETNENYFTEIQQKFHDSQYSNKEEEEEVIEDEKKLLAISRIPETDTLIQWLIKASLEINFNESVWTIKRIYWAYSRPLLGQKFHSSRISHWIFEYIAEKRFEDQLTRNIPSADMDKCRKWVSTNVKARNTVRGVPVFRYVKLIQPLLNDQGGDGSTEKLMQALGINNIKELHWDMKQLEEIAKKEKDEEKAKQKLYQQNSLQDPTKSKKTLKKRKKHKDQLDIDYNNFISKMKSEMQLFPKVSVWEADDSFLVALEVPGLIKSTLQHKASVIVLEVQGMCRFPEIIENKWPATLSFGKEFKRTIEFSKPINPSESGLIDVPCEGIIFYKCSKQLNLQPMKISQNFTEQIGSTIHSFENHS